MPIHLPPPSATSRRQFLQGITLATGAMCFRSIRTDAALGEPERWAFLSDTHIAADPAFVSKQGVNLTENLKRVIAEVMQERDQLDGLFVNGDCAFNEGLRGDYDTFAKLLEPVRESGLPIHLTMGNHDDRGPFYEALSAQRPKNPPVEGKHVSVVEGRAVNWVFLDSLRFVNKVEGEFGEAQLKWLEGYLSANAAKPVLLVGHHYPQVFRDDVIPGDEKIKISGLVDSEAFLALADRHPQVKVYIYGHSHDWKTLTGESGLHQVNLPPTAYVFNPAKPNGWVRGIVSSEGLSLELRALDTSHPQHGQKVELKWRA
ncbi:MAG: metallophosphoesterase [Verrucomicrobiae bacterium]|nr:metallophosphoesterase [Verrucomicrobiae bacterium]